MPLEPVNLFAAENADGRIDVARATGSTGLLMYAYDLAPGQSSCPYHYEHEEEWLLIVDGTVVVRTPAGEQTLKGGDIVCFPAGASGAHKITNRSETPARTLLFSRATWPAVSVYPDSDKLSVRAAGDESELVFRVGSAVPWSEGEDGWDRAS